MKIINVTTYIWHECLTMSNPKQYNNIDIVMCQDQY
jgi:hypothetical protein